MAAGRHVGGPEPAPRYGCPIPEPDASPSTLVSISAYSHYVRKAKRGDFTVTINTVESFFALLERGTTACPII